MLELNKSPFKDLLLPVFVLFFSFLIFVNMRLSHIIKTNPSLFVYMKSTLYFYEHIETLNTG